MIPLGIILCEKSIPRIPEAWKRFLDPDSGNEVGVLKRKSNIFWFLWENRRFLGFSRREIDWAHSRTVKTLPWPWFREEIGVLKRKSIYLSKYASLSWIMVKEAFLRFGNAPKFPLWIKRCRSLWINFSIKKLEQI